MIERASGFDWDNGNWAKCEKHGVSIAEIEALFLSRPLIAPDLRHIGAEDRLIAVGRTRDRRPIFVAFTLRLVGGATLIRPISARYMHAKEMARYDAHRS
jgi:uncharacterized DUF497 family protein